MSATAPAASQPGPPPARSEPTRRPAGTWRRNPPGLELWAGVALLLFYVAVALSALVVFHGTLDRLITNSAWFPAAKLGPTWSTPFGVLTGFGVSLSTALWQATPWDLGMVIAILAIDAGLGALFGALAGLYEGRWPDTAITFVTDSLGSIPSVFLVVVVFAGLTFLAPADDSLVLFVILFGLILWPTCARIVRERARIVVHQPYVEAAWASGASKPRVLFRHVIPNSIDPILAQIPVDVAAIFLVLTLFPWFRNCAGPYIPPPGVPGVYAAPVLPSFSPLPYVNFPEWGNLLAWGTCEGAGHPGLPLLWWEFVFPLAAMVGLGVAIALTCDGLDRWLRRRA